MIKAQSSAEFSSFQNGRYEIISRLGTGGVATVWRVRDTKFQLERAIKVLLMDVSADKGYASKSPSNSEIRFSREAKLMMQLQHANIVTVFDSFEEDNALCIVMEKCLASLSSWVQCNQHMPVSLAVQVTISVLKALSIAHQNGVVHRDVKPHNILISNNGEVKLTDFGLAMSSFASNSITKTNAILGSIQFMSPEQRQSAHDIEATSDLYSTAMTLVYLLEGRTIGDLYVTENIEYLRTKYPQQIVDVIQKAGALHPASRYQSAEEMGAILHKILGTLPKSEISLLEVQSEEVLWDVAEFSNSVVENNTMNNTVEITLPKTVYGVFAIILILLGLIVVNLFSDRSSTTVLPSAPTYTQCPNSPSAYQNQNVLGPRETRAAKFFDIDNDNYMDAVFVSLLDRTLSIYWGNEDFELGVAQEMRLERSVSAPLFSDVDRDGLIDIIGLHAHNNKISISKNLGSRQFRGMEEFGRDEMFQEPPPLRGAMHDINDDGWEDIIFSAINVNSTNESLIVRYNSRQGLDFSITNIPNTEEETFNWQKFIASIPGIIFFGQAQPNIFWMENDQLFRQYIGKNGVLDKKILLLDNLEDASILDVSTLNQNTDFVFIQQGEQIIVWSADREPCLLYTSFSKPKRNPFMTEIAFGDWNQDNVIDALQTISCAYCTSNHMLWVGQ